MEDLNFEFGDYSNDKKESIEERNEKYERVITFLTKIGYFDLIKDDKKYEEFIQKLSFEQFKNILISFNALLRNNKLKNKGTSEAVVKVGGVRGIRKELRDDLLKNIYESLKQIKDDKERATFLYYQLLRLHMFSDGNGRTSRFMYQVLTKQEDFNSVKKYFVHENDSQGATTNYDKNKEAFYKVNDIMSETQVSTDLSSSNLELLNKYVNDLPEYMKNKRIAALPLDDEENANPKKVNELIEKNLNDNEKSIFKEYMKDNAGNFAVVSFILTVINSKKNNLDYIYESDKERFINAPAFVFNTLDPNTYRNWTRDDFLLAIKLGDESKKYNIDILNDIFINNNKHCGISKDDLFISNKSKELNSMFEKNEKSIEKTGGVYGI